VLAAELAAAAADEDAAFLLALWLLVAVWGGGWCGGSGVSPVGPVATLAGSAVAY
jgi:hypothetical protein